MGFITTTLNLILTACFTGIGVAIGNALYEKYLKHHIHKLPDPKKEEQQKNG